MRHVVTIALLLSPLGVPLVHADSALQYRLSGHESTQPILIRQGKVLIPGLDGGDHRDLLYDRGLNEAVLIDHKAQTYVKVNKETIERVTRLSEPLQPLLAGVGSQLKNLTPEQRAKWQGMLGGIDLDKLANVSRAGSPMRVTKDGGQRKIGNFTCDQVSILRGKDKVAEMCLSQADVLGLTADDYSTLRSLLDFAQRLAKQTRGLSSLMGFSIPVVSVQDLPGIPVEIRSMSSQHPATASLASIDRTGSGSMAMTVPEGYRGEDLKLW